MIKGEKRKQLTIDSILEKVTEYDIYRYYIGDFTIGKCIKSPFRRDSNPSFSIDATKKGRLRHKDFGDERYTGSCVDLVMQMYDLTFTEALRRIESDLGLSSGKPFVSISFYTPEEIMKTKKKIYALYREFTEEDLKYWGQYEITKEELLYNDVFSVERVYINNYCFHTEGIRFAYELQGPVKIYSPLETRKEYKWITNAPIDTISGWNILPSPDGGPIVITKSKKDEIVLKKIFRNVISVQNESQEALPKYIVEHLKTRYENIYLAFDNDDTGKKNSKILCDMYNLKPIFVPDEYYPIKDYAELIKYRGIDVLKEEIYKQL